MSKTSTLNISVSVNGDGVNSSYSVPAVQNTASPGGGPVLYALVNGFNQIPVPPGAQGVIITPPAGSAITKTLKGITGDTGVPLNPALPTVLSLPAGATSIGITAGGVENVSLDWL